MGDGLAEVAERERVSVAGGDFTRAPVLTLTVACIGYERPGAQLVTRAGAQPGDALCVTGELGGAGGALIALGLVPAAGGRSAAAIEATGRESLLARQFDPRPRLAAGRALAVAGATAMIDVSDGLGVDAGHLAAASGVAIQLELNAVPLCPELAELLGGERPARELAISGGEDYELLVALPPGRLDVATEALAGVGVGLTQVGRASQGEGVEIRDGDGELVEPAGFDHMRGSDSGSGPGSGSG